MVFKKERMIARLEKEGRTDQITDVIDKIMDNLDGQPATTSCWQRQVFGEPLLWVVGKDGIGQYVNKNDCI